MPAADNPWLNICRIAPSIAMCASLVPDAKAAAAIPRTTKPMWLIDEYATSRLKSVWAYELKAPKTIAAVARKAKAPAKYLASTGYKGNTRRKKPYAPSLSITPASIMEPAVGASVWASGSQVWNGQTGILTANAITNPQKTTDFTVEIGKPSNKP